MATSKADAYAPKWRHFHPSATVWVHNPFDHDVLFDVADEYNVPYVYRMPANKTSELPGGAVATLGVKAIVDELIQNSASDQYAMWEVGVRTKYEEQIIVRIKESPTIETISRGGEVNLGVDDSAVEEDEGERVTAEPTPFAGQFDEDVAINAPAGIVGDIAAQSLGNQDTVIED